MSSVGSVIGSIFNTAKTNSNSSATTTSASTSFADMMGSATNTNISKSSLSDKDDAVSAFMKYQKMSIAEKIRASYLAAHKLTEEDVAQMEPKEREKIEKQIADAIRRKITSQSQGTAQAS